MKKSNLIGSLKVVKGLKIFIYDIVTKEYAELKLIGSGRVSVKYNSNHIHIQALNLKNAKRKIEKLKL